MGAISLVPGGAPAVAGKPGDRPFAPPAVPAEPFTPLARGACDTWNESSPPQPGEVFGEEIRLGGGKLDKPAPLGPAVGADRGYAADHSSRAGPSCVFAPGTGTASGMRCASDSTCGSLPLLPRSTGARPGERALFPARTEAASTIADVRSGSPRAPSSSRTARCSWRHSPARVHTVNAHAPSRARRRTSRADAGHTRWIGTYTTAVNSARSSHAADPPPCRRALSARRQRCSRPGHQKPTAATEQLPQAAMMPHLTTAPHEKGSESSQPVRTEWYTLRRPTSFARGGAPRHCPPREPGHISS